MIYILIFVFFILMMTTVLSTKTYLHMMKHIHIVDEESYNKTKCCYHEKYDCDDDGVCVSQLEKRCGLLAEASCTQSFDKCDSLTEEECTMDTNKRVCEYESESGKCTNIVNPYNSNEIPCSEYKHMTIYGFKSNELNCDKRFSVV